MKLLISAAEASSDVHAAELVRALRQKLPEGETLEIFGIGGPKLRAAGLQVLVDARELLAMGATEVLGRVPRILAALRQVAGAAEREAPDLAVVLDYPEFHFKLAARLRKLGVPVVYYIPPKLWVWRKKRIRKLRELFVRVLCILPFEERFYREEGMPVRYVGNPLLDELPLGMSREEARARLSITTDERVLALMPGSRPAEIDRHLELLLESAQRAALGLRQKGWLGAGQKLLALVPLPETADLQRVLGRVEAWRPAGTALEVRVSQGDAGHVLLAADAGLIKSGTSTLEAGLLGLPHGVMYRPSAVTGFIFKHLVRYRDPVGLVNLMVRDERGRPVRITEELLCEQAEPARLGELAMRLLADPAERARLARDFERLRQVVMGGPGNERPSARAAAEILDVWRARAGRSSP